MDLANVLIENLIQVAAAACITLISLVLSWVASQFGKSKKLGNIENAIWQLRSATENSVLELQKTLVDELKTANEDGKLTAAEIENLHSLLIDLSMKKLNKPAQDILTAAGVDLSAIILGAGEELLKRIENAKKNAQLPPVPVTPPNVK